MSGRPAGFTLVELLLAITTSTIVLVGAMAALNTMSEATALATQRLEEATGIDRAIRLFRRDFSWAQSYKLNGDQLQLVMKDGSAIVYQATKDGYQLHRVTGPDLATALAANTGLNNLAAPVFTTRGHLQDTSYRSSAILQGIRDIKWEEFTGPVTGTKIGVKLTITYMGSSGLQIQYANAILLAKVAPNADDP